MNDGYSVCFNEWALDKEIKNELGLLLIISSLCAENGFCWATNKYLGELFNEPEQTISRKLKKLSDKGYIKIDYERRGTEIIKREIRLTKMLMDHYQKCEPTINKNVKENNINNNNINNNKRNIKESFNDEVEEVVEYLNEKTNCSYKPNTKSTAQHIKARLKEGFTVDDFKKVIDSKVEDWLHDDKMRMYLRPETLFSTKFESYLQEALRRQESVEVSNNERPTLLGLPFD